MESWKETFDYYAEKYAKLTGRYAYYEHQKGNGNYLFVGTTKLVSEANGHEACIGVEGYKEASTILLGIICSIECNGFEAIEE